MFAHGAAITVRRPGGWSDQGEALPPTEHQVPGCWWAPRTSNEDTDLRHTVITGYDLYGPYDADLRSTDQVLLPGVLDDEGAVDVWQVDGDVGRWGSPYTGRRPGMQAALKRATG